MSFMGEKSLKFGVRIYRLCKYLDEKKEFIISKQLLRCVTSVGANIFEAIHAESDQDYIHKYSIAQKECSETLYWLEILKSTSILSEEEFQSIHNDANELMSLLVASLKTLKSKKKKNSPKK